MGTDRPRYAMVRNPIYEQHMQQKYPDTPWAFYDIVDNQVGAERVLAYGVRYKAALEIVGALNVQEELVRLNACREEVTQI